MRDCGVSSFARLTLTIIPLWESGTAGEVVLKTFLVDLW